MNRVAPILICAFFFLACGQGLEEGEAISLDAVPIERHEGAVCGMIVADQSAPRGQVVHRDGTRSFVCSIGDLLAYLEAPSPHGRAASILVEVMDPNEDPSESHPEAHPWVRAEEAVYVVGIERPRIMGEPVLVYRDTADAERAMVGTPGTALGFTELQQWWQARHEDAPGKGAFE